MWIVAFSGGADSVLAAHRAAASGKPITLWYLHHYSTPVEPARLRVFDETRVRYPAARWQQNQADVSRVAKRLGYSWEHTASLVRRKWLLRLRARTPGSDVVTGHNYSDYLETLALRRERKIPEEFLPPLAECDDTTGFLRPLFQLTRDEVRQEVRNLGFSYFDDPANEDLNFARNRVRNAPSPQAKPAASALPSLGVGYSRELRLPLPAWNALPPTAQARTLFAAFRRLAIVRKFTRSHFSRAHRLPFSLPPFFAHSELLRAEPFVVFRRGLGNQTGLPRPENDHYLRGDAVTRAIKLPQPYGRKSVAKIFSEHRLSPRDRRRTLVYMNPERSNEAVRIVLPAEPGTP